MVHLRSWLRCMEDMAVVVCEEDVYIIPFSFAPLIVLRALLRRNAPLYDDSRCFVIVTDREYAGLKDTASAGSERRLRGNSRC